MDCVPISGPIIKIKVGPAKAIIGNRATFPISTPVQPPQKIAS